MDLEKDTVKSTGDKEMVNFDSIPNEHIDEYLRIYSKMAENIKDEHFEEISEIVKSGKMNLNFNIDGFRKTFVASFSEIVNKMYEARDLKKKVSVIKILEDRYKNKEPSKWHPYGKNAEEQAVSKRIEMLNKRKDFMFKIVESQRTILEETVNEVEKNRKRFEELTARRAELISNLEMKTEELKNLKDVYTNLRLKISREFER